MHFFFQKGGRGQMQKTEEEEEYLGKQNAEENKTGKRRLSLTNR